MSDAEFANKALGGLFNILQHLTETRDSLDDLAERYGAEITDHTELVRALRWQVEFYKDKPREMQERIGELKEQVRDLEESNGDLRAMVRTSYAKTFGARRMEATT